MLAEPKTDAAAAVPPQREIGIDLISVPHAARLIGIHADTLYRLCRSGRFSPAVQIGARWRVSVPRLERYLHGDSSGP
jgi:excisionase family DNA binding protein